LFHYRVPPPKESIIDLRESPLEMSIAVHPEFATVLA
jgi:hypothetical protein